MITLSKFLKYTSLGLLGFVVVGELYHPFAMMLKAKFEKKDEADITEIIFTRQPMDYTSRLTRDITFKRDQLQHSTELLENIIASANHTILIAMYIFTSEPLAQALIAVHKRGVKVSLIVDHSMEHANSSKAALLHRVGMSVKIHDTSTLHHKICLVDVPYDERKKKLVAHNPDKRSGFEAVSIPSHGLAVTGSLNWTREALINNQENFIVTTNKIVCERSAAEFYEMWNTSRPHELH